MKNIRLLITIIFILFVTSCSIQSRMNHKFNGKDKSSLDAYFKQKGTIVTLPGNIKYVEYSQTKQLESIEIGKGGTTLDPMNSPAVEKNQRYTFYLDANNKVTSCKYEREYKR